ncbi:hypothetical protein B0H13DRAFT_2096463 [Mycena leptocephala]|nr:hypothetical protein B0H13DRAFT_2096463 [Mycena leptocephala]
MDTTDLDTPALTAMRLPFPDGCDEFLRSSSDGSTDHESAYERARAHAVILGNTRVAWLWRHALEIGLRTGLGRSILQKSTDAFLLGHESGFKEGREAGLKEGRTGGLRDGKQDGRKAGKIQGLKEGEAIGFTKGQEDGLKEGKRQGFVAGREFGEKQALKLSKTSAPERVFVDVGTDSPVAELVPPPPPSSAPIHVPLPPATPHRTVTHSTPLRPPPNWSDLRLYAPNSTNSLPLPASLSSEIPVAIPQSPAVPFDWADDAKSLAIPLPPRDLSVLRTPSTPLTPFGTLQHRAYRTKKSRRAYRAPTTPITTRRHPHGLGPGRPFSTTTPASHSVFSVLDWDHDARLSGLSRALRSLGWVR